jgi:nucleoside-diphosphate-sugar epimerase
MKAIVTGAAGFIGQNLILELIRRGHDVIGIDERTPLIGSVASVTSNCSLMDDIALAEVVRQTSPDVVFHLGARTDLHGRGIADYRVNTEGTGHLIETLKRQASGIHCIYASSRLVFAIDHRPVSLFDYKPSTPYGESKVQMERMVRTYASDAGTWTIVRPTSIWGPLFGVPYRDFFDAVRRGRYVKVAGTNPQKSFGYVGNAVHQLISLALLPPERVDKKALWLTDYEPVDVNAMSDLIALEFAVRLPRTVPRIALTIAAALGSSLQRLGVPDPPITKFRLSNLLADVVYDASATEALVGPIPFSLSEGVSRTVEWIRTSN